MPETAIPVRTRGFKKKERTRRQLVEAGVRVLAARGEGLTVSDVVAEAEVSNGTFYNYFPDREVFIDAVAEHSALALAADAAKRPIEDPAERFALARAGGRTTTPHALRPPTAAPFGETCTSDTPDQT